MANQALIPVDGYVRVSRVGDRGDKLLSPELQRESCERVCAREGLRVVRWYEELDASGGDNTRPKWNEAIERVEQGKTRGLVVWNLSRFSRSVKDALNALERIESAGGRLYSEEGNLGKLDRAIRLAIAEDERDRAVIGFRNVRANAINRAVYIAAYTPFGYKRNKERKLEVDPEAAPIVRDLFEHRADGWSWGRISTYATEKYDRRFPRSTVASMVSNRAYLGIAYHGDLENERAHEPIISQILWNKAHSVDSTKYVATGASRVLILRGIVKCASCGLTMRAGHRRGKRDESGNPTRVPTYQCRNNLCESPAFVSFATELDSFVSEAVRSYLRFASVEQRDKASDPLELRQAEEELEQMQDALETFKKNRKAIVTLGVDEWNELLTEYVVARDMAQTRVDALRESHEDSFTLLDEQWDEWTSESRNEFLSKIISDLRVERKGRGRRDLTFRDLVNLSVTFAGAEAEIHSPVTGFSLGSDYRDKEVTFR